jgi:hypothetical protein
MLYYCLFYTDVDHAIPTEEQYSLQHARLSALSNHILADPWSSGHVYTVVSDWTVMKGSINPEVQK